MGVDMLYIVTYCGAQRFKYMACVLSLLIVLVL